MNKALGDRKRKFKPTLKLGSYFASKTCTEMSKQQKLAARITEGEKVIALHKRFADGKREAKRARDLENGPVAAFREWQDEHFRLIRVDCRKRIARAALANSKISAEEMNVCEVGGSVIIVPRPPASADESTATAAAASATSTHAADIEERAAKRVRGSYKKWDPIIKDQALAAVRARGGDISRAIEYLQNDEVMNASVEFWRLTRGTLDSWWQDALSGLLVSGGGRGACARDNPQSQCPLSDVVLVELKKEIVMLGGEGATLNSTSIYPVWYEVAERKQPTVFTEPLANGRGVFKMSKSWINALCLTWGFSMQKTTTTSNHLPENWEELLELQNLRVAFMVATYKIPRALWLTGDETPVKCVANAETTTRHKVNSGDVFGVMKDCKMQITAIPQLSAAGVIGAASKAEREAPGYVPKPEPKTVLIFSGVEYRKKGNKKTGEKSGDPAFSSCPTHLAEQFPEFVMCQTPTHFCRFSSVVIMFEKSIVPFFEEEIERLGLVGQKTIDAFKARGDYDSEDPEMNPEHQAVRGPVLLARAARAVGSTRNAALE